MKKQFLSLAVMAIFASASLAVTAEQASARGFHRSTSVQGSQGHGYNKTVDRSCNGGACTGSRSVQTNSGRGYTSSHARSCANGSCSSSTTVTGNNGNVWTRSGGATRNGDGSAQWYSTTTGPNGGTVARSGSVSVTPPEE